VDTCGKRIKLRTEANTGGWGPKKTKNKGGVTMRDRRIGAKVDGKNKREDVVSPTLTPLGL